MRKKVHRMDEVFSIYVYTDALCVGLVKYVYLRKYIKDGLRY